MEISFLQALAIGLYAGISGIDLFNGLTHIHRPLVSGVVVGLILGNLPVGLLAGATLELVFMGAVAIGGAQPPNVVVGGIIGAVFAISSGQDPKIAVGIAIPFAVAVQAFITFLFTVYSPVMRLADKYADQCDDKGIARIGYWGMAILFVFYFTVTFFPSWLGSAQASKLVSIIPSWLTNGLSFAGGIMPAVGFAVLLKIMYQNKLVIFLLAGFLLTAYLKVPILALALLATCVAAYDYLQRTESTPKQAEDYSDGI